MKVRSPTATTRLSAVLLFIKGSSSLHGGIGDYTTASICYHHELHRQKLVPLYNVPSWSVVLTQHIQTVLKRFSSDVLLDHQELNPTT